jgi:membrane protein
MGAAARLTWAAVGAAAAAGFLAGGAMRGSTARAPAKTGAAAADPHEPSMADLARAAEPGRGREAAAPAAIPAPGWRDVFWRVVAEAKDDRLFPVAAGVAFYALLALFPAAAALVSVYGVFADPATLAQHLALMSGVLPAAALALVSEFLAGLVAKPPDTLGIAMLVGLGFSIWSANAGTLALVEAMNVVYDESEKRGTIALYALSLALTFGAVVFLAAAVALIVVVPVALAYVGLGAVGELLIGVGRWPLLLLAAGLAIAVVYRIGPSRRGAKWRWILPGAAFAAVAWMIVCLLFSLYVSRFGNYDKVYGSLGAVVVLMLWLWLTAAIVLLGAEINAEMEHQTARDTTVGGGRPMGSRDAMMADHVGQSA